MDLATCISLLQQGVYLHNGTDMSGTDACVPASTHIVSVLAMIMSTIHVLPLSCILMWYHKD